MSPFDRLPLPNANEYPYNPQGDQTKARVLAAAASSGDPVALERLKSIGLDAGGNIAPASARAPLQGTDPNQVTDRERFEEDNRRYNDQKATADKRYSDQQAEAQQRKDEQSAMTARRRGDQEDAQYEAQQAAALNAAARDKQARDAAKRQSQPRGGRGGRGVGGQEPARFDKAGNPLNAAARAANKVRDRRIESRDREESARRAGKTLDAEGMRNAKDIFFDRRKPGQPINKGEGNGGDSSGIGVSDEALSRLDQLVYRDGRPYNKGTGEYLDTGRKDAKAKAPEVWKDGKKVGSMEGDTFVPSAEKGETDEEKKKRKASNRQVVGFFKRGGITIPITARV
jgi:hypothetical protein